jgi:DNA repair exonuclease SbcCD ATPase subunit
MNTFRIYEDFRESLGEPAAKALAQTLGGMFEELRNTVTKEDFRGLTGEIDRQVSRLDTALVDLTNAQNRTEQRVEELAQAQNRTEQRVEELAHAQNRTEQRVEELAQAQNRTEQRVEELAHAQKDTETQIKQLTLAQQKTETELHLLVKVVKRQSPRLDAALGRSLELQFRDRMTSYLWRFLKQGRLVSLSELSRQLESALDEESLDDLSRADAIATGLVAGKEAFIVVEVSSKADANDVRRVVRWAGLLEKAGLPAIPLVACDFISDQAMRFAGQQGVRVFKQGRLLATPAA